MAHRIRSLEFFVFFGLVAGFAACLPQGARTMSSPSGSGGGSSSDEVMAAAENTAGPAAEDSVSNTDETARRLSPIGAVAENGQGVMMPSGQLAPEGTVEENQKVVLRGTKENECSLPGGRTRVHIVGRAYWRDLEGQESPVDDWSAGIRIYFRVMEGERKEMVRKSMDFVEVPYSFLSRDPREIQAKNGDKNFFEATVITTDSDSLDFYPESFREPLLPNKVGAIPALDELREIGSARLGPCIEAQLTTRP